MTFLQNVIGVTLAQRAKRIDVRSCIIIAARDLMAPTPRLGGSLVTQTSIVDCRSPAQIAQAILKVNKIPEMRHAGLDALWRLYYAPEHSMARTRWTARSYIMCESPKSVSMTITAANICSFS
jgi:hypothetical protein